MAHPISKDQIELALHRVWGQYLSDKHREHSEVIAEFIERLLEALKEVGP